MLPLLSLNALVAIMNNSFQVSMLNECIISISLSFSDDRIASLTSYPATLQNVSERHLQQQYKEWAQIIGKYLCILTC